MIPQKIPHLFVGFFFTPERVSAKIKQRGDFVEQRIQRILSELDELFSRNDYKTAKNRILTWLDGAEGDLKTILLLKNELMGLCRKCGQKDEAIAAAEGAIAVVREMGIEENVGAGTTYLNSATVYKAFDMPEKAIGLFEKTLKIYEKKLSPNDKRFGGLYNNMALALVDLKRFDEAYNYYQKAIFVMQSYADGAPEAAITYLNIASAVEAELGLEDGEKKINEKAIELLDSYPKRDGNYAFVCEKCASVFGYYGYFAYKKKLDGIVRSIYERA